MTGPTDQQSGSTFVPEPISVHTIDEAEYRKWFGRAMGPALKALVVIFVIGGAGAVLLWTVGGGRDADDLATVIVGAMVGLLVMSVTQFYLHRWWQLKLWRGTRIELWPDCIIRRIEGRPPLVIRKEDVASICVRQGRARMLIIRSRQGYHETMGIPGAVVGFDQLCEHVQSWGVRESRNAWARLKDPWYVFGGLMPLVALYVVLLTGNPVVASALTLVAVSAAALFAWQLWTGKHRDKWTRRLVWLSPVFYAVVLGACTFDKWLRYYDVPFDDFMRAIFPWW